MTAINDGFCHAKRGLLMVRDCGKHALSSCESCGTGLCEDHQILTGYGVFCPECAVRDNRLDGLEDERLDRVRYRREGGYYSGGYYYAFSENDYETFDRQAAEGDESATIEDIVAEALEGEDASLDSDDLDSFMES